jgi:hypothetical protein
MEKTMKLLKYLLPIAMATCGFAATLMADDFSTVKEARERDADAVNAFIKSKRAITVQEKGGALMVSGDIHAEWSHLRCWTHHRRRRGSQSSKRRVPQRPHAPFATNEFTIEANLMFDYRTERTWASIQMQMSNAAGIKNQERVRRVNWDRNFMYGSGSLDNLVLRRAYMGYNVIEHGTSRFDIEIGRRRGYDFFDSKIQFYNFFDGIYLKYANSFEGITDFTAKTAAFVVDFRANHFAWAGELGFLNMADLGLDFKYSLIKWKRDAANAFGKEHAKGSKFINSQYTLAYNLSPDWIHYRTTVYGAFVHNHDAPSSRRTHHKKAANAWYAGAKMGQVKRQGDWSVEANYQWVEAQAIPESDCSGICRDNPQNISFYQHKWAGFANYKGWMVDTYYALTDNLTLNMNADRVHQAERRIGGKHRSWQFQLAAIYAF